MKTPFSGFFSFISWRLLIPAPNVGLCPVTRALPEPARGPWRVFIPSCPINSSPHSTHCGRFSQTAWLSPHQPNNRSGVVIKTPQLDSTFSYFHALLSCCFNGPVSAQAFEHTQHWWICALICVTPPPLPQHVHGLITVTTAKRTVISTFRHSANISSNKQKTEFSLFSRSARVPPGSNCLRFWTRSESVKRGSSVGERTAFGLMLSLMRWQPFTSAPRPLASLDMWDWSWHFIHLPAS